VNLLNFIQDKILKIKTEEKKRKVAGMQKKRNQQFFPSLFKKSKSDSLEVP